MVSKNIKFLSMASASLILVVFLVACTVGPAPDESGNNIIGTNLTAVSSLTTEQGADQPKVALYDNTVDLIHQFDLTTGNLDRTLHPRYPGGTHYVLFDSNGNYVVDLTLQHFTIHNKQGSITEPLRYVGTPKSASFHPSLGFLVIYDDMHSVGLIHLDSNGNSLGQVMLGPIVGNDISITAGDIDDQGRLILSLSNNTIALIDISQSIANNEWTYWQNTSPFTVPALQDIDWIGPIHDNTNQILVKTKTSPQVALVDVSAQAIVGSPISISGMVLKTSKSFDPHILVATGNGQVNMIFAQSSALITHTTFNQMNNVLDSRLNLSNDTWSIVDSAETVIRIGFSDYRWILYNDANATTQGRKLKKYEAKHLLEQYEIPLPDTAKLQLTEAHVFELFPNKLGYAVNYSIGDGSKTELKLFNYPYLH